ncbi:phage portal protein [Paracoccus suum]|uniref:Phage portal protein n=1 Tax=Paracoccus suum TaxID=2259340 RepID=A0A344PLX3_9RHOB|nr:phage portal protein [Paracoccus suum]AXC50378.1 phage portal protein [Paracoccus suum]
MRWPWQTPEVETRSTPVVTAQYIDARRGIAVAGDTTSLSATVGTCAGIWSRSFAMLVPDPVDDLTPDILAAVGLDLFFRGESLWHIGLDQSRLTLRRAASWSEYAGGRYSLALSTPGGSKTVRALEDEVVKLTINAAPESPWRGRSPLALMGLSASLLADLEQTVSSALPYTGKGLLPIPSTVPEDQKTTALQGLRHGSLAVVGSKEDFGHHTGGSRSEFKRVELTPDLSGVPLVETTRDLHERVLAAAGVPPSLFTASGNAGASREALRLFTTLTLDPLARAITPELARKIGVTRLGLQDLATADTAGRARSVSSLVQSGVPLATAMSLVGWDNVDLPEGASKPINSGGE